MTQETDIKKLKQELYDLRKYLVSISCFMEMLKAQQQDAIRRLSCVLFTWEINDKD